jgi:hypothetical protein
MKIIILQSIKRTLVAMVLFVILLNLNSCGIGINIREQGNAKSWGISEKKTESLRTHKKENEQFENRTQTSPVNRNIVQVNNLKSESHLEGQQQENKQELLLKNEIGSNRENSQLDNSKVTELLKQNRSEILKTKKTSKNYNQFKLPKVSTAKKIKLLESNVEKSAINTDAPNKNRSVFYALMTLLFFWLSYVAIYYHIKILFQIFFILAIILLIFTIVNLFLRPKPSVAAIILSVLLTILNLFIALLYVIIMVFGWTDS